MSGYVGLKVCIVLVDNRRCEGIIAAVDPVTQKITLQDACFQSKSTSYANQRLPFITISGAEVHDIQILENMKPKSKVPDDPAIIQFSSSPTQNIPQIQNPNINKTSNSVARKLNFDEEPDEPKYQEPDNSNYYNSHRSPHKNDYHSNRNNQRNYNYNYNDNYYPKQKSPYKKQYQNYPDDYQGNQNYPSSSPRKKGREYDHQDWEVDNIYYQNEFDFAENLKLFDKEKEFAQIKEEEKINPESRLVTHNRKPRNLGIHENVLENLNISDPQNYNNMGFYFVDVFLPSITFDEKIKLFEICEKEEIMFETEIIENIGRSICAFVLHIIEDSVNNEVIILAGNNMHGSYGFCAARHLLNHNVKVKIFFFEEKLELMHEAVYKQFISCKASGCTIFSNKKELLQINQSISLVIDAFCEPYHIEPKNQVHFLSNWANNTKANVLSIELPFGNPTSHGLFNLKWTITFCVPLQDHLNLSSEVILADSGIPATVFSKSRINYRSPFKDKFFVRLEKK